MAIEPSTAGILMDTFIEEQRDGTITVELHFKGTGATPAEVKAARAFRELLKEACNATRNYKFKS